MILTLPEVLLGFLCLHGTAPQVETCPAHTDGALYCLLMLAWLIPTALWGGGHSGFIDKGKESQVKCLLKVMQPGSRRVGI